MLMRPWRRRRQRLQREAAVLRVRLRVRVRAVHGRMHMQASDSGAAWHWTRRLRCTVRVRM